ncbi:carboxymuconolactone decarboxylase family protein [Chloroflexota bacterium]
MDDEEKAIYDKFLGDIARILTGLRGPLGINMQNPKLGQMESNLNRYLRLNTGIEARIRELAILTVAREMDSEFEWAAHESEAIKEGLEENIINTIKHRKRVKELDAKEAIIIKLGREIFRKKKVSSDTYALALNIFGRVMLVNIIALMANYTATAVKLRVFNNQTGHYPILPR